MEKIDFLISPAYSVPPIKMIRSFKEMTTNVSDAVPSTLGSALQVGADKIVNPGSCSSYSCSVRVINKRRANKLCPAYSLITSTGRRYFSSAPANAFKEKTSSLLDKCSVTLRYNRSKEASSIG